MPLPKGPRGLSKRSSRCSAITLKGGLASAYIKRLPRCICFGCLVIHNLSHSLHGESESYLTNDEYRTEYGDDCDREAHPHPEKRP